MPATRLEEPTLTGAPARLRLKTYSSEAGNVYQYIYRGQQAEDRGTTFVFSVTTNRKDWQRVSVRLNGQTIAEWEGQNGRTLRGIDLYAIAKMSLFEAFDRSDGTIPGSAVQPDARDVSRLLDTLGLL
jgi:hypothetical protein